MLQITVCDCFGFELFHSLTFRARMRGQSTRGALRVIPRGKQRLTVYRAHQVHDPAPRLEDFMVSICPEVPRGHRASRCIDALHEELIETQQDIPFRDDFADEEGVPHDLDGLLGFVLTVRLALIEKKHRPPGCSVRFGFHFQASERERARPHDVDRCLTGSCARAQSAPSA